MEFFWFSPVHGYRNSNCEGSLTVLVLFDDFQSIYVCVSGNEVLDFFYII